MNTRPVNEAVVAKWKDLASDRRTVVFCSANLLMDKLVSGHSLVQLFVSRPTPSTFAIGLQQWGPTPGWDANSFFFSPF